VFEMLIPGVLQRREHGSIGLGGVGQLVKNQQPALVLKLRGGRLPEIRPARERGCARGGRISVDQVGEQLPALDCSRCFFCDPVGKWRSALLGPVPEQGRFSHPAPTI
jgi:hypothetical protein